MNNISFKLNRVGEESKPLTNKTAKDYAKELGLKPFKESKHYDEVKNKFSDVNEFYVNNEDTLLIQKYLKKDEGSIGYKLCSCLMNEHDICITIPEYITDVEHRHDNDHAIFSYSHIKSLKVINKSKFLTDVSYMFSNYLGESLDLTEFDTSKVINMRGMFTDCWYLDTLLLGENFNTSQVTDMSEMFCRCMKLPVVNFGDKFDTSEVINMRGMFYGCSKFSMINLEDKFDTSNVTNMEYMFYDCENLFILDLGNKFKTDKVMSMNNMFTGCHSSAIIKTRNIRVLRQFDECIEVTVVDDYL